MTRAAHRVPPLRSLAELRSRWNSHAQAHAAATRDAAAAAARAARQQHADEAVHELFARSVGPVFPLRGAHRSRAEVDAPKPPPHPRQRELDEQDAVRASRSDALDAQSLLLTDDGLSFRRPGIGADVVSRLRCGRWALQAQIDLHGLNRDQARDALAEFIRASRRRGMRCLRIVHGKGHGSPGREPVLKTRVQHWLAQSAEVIAFVQASGPQGGAGALVVLLAAARA